MSFLDLSDNPQNTFPARFLGRPYSSHELLNENLWEVNGVSKRAVSIPVARRRRHEDPLAKRKQQFACSTSPISIVVGRYHGFEGCVVICIFEHANNSLCCHTMPNGIASRMLFALLRRRSCAFQRFTSIGDDLLERTHLKITPVVVNSGG